MLSYDFETSFSLMLIIVKVNHERLLVVILALLVGKGAFTDIA